MSEISGCDIRWTVAECDEALAERLAKEAGVPAVVARVLVNRGIETNDELKRFMDPELSHLRDPSLLPDLDTGVERVAAAVTSGEPIFVHGDYDVDGVTSTALLVRTLRALKANVDYRLPHRQKEGYDIKPAAVEEAAAKGAGVILTCDCGINALETVACANNAGIDMVITDHHEPGPHLPPAKAVINPKRSDADYPFPDLAGVGVAFKFAQGLVRKLGYDEEGFQAKFVDLAALGTVGDVVPLLDENRAMVKHGLAAIPRSKKVGLRTMLRTTRLEGKPMTAFYLAYVLGPRINSVGRMDDASTALRLFLTRDEAEARGLAEEMERCNSERRAEQERILAEAMELAESKDAARSNVMVLSKEGWNSGVVGIVAGKICDAYGRPAILISRDETSGMGGGSARSIDGFNILEGLRHCADLLNRFGGHALAAGLSLALDNVEEFEERINALAQEVISEEDLVPGIDVDAELAPEDITWDLACALNLLEPFGMGNPEPLFVTRDLVVLDRQRVGDGSHLRMRLRGEGCAPVTCIAFGLGDCCESVQLGGVIDLCYSIRLNTYNGTESVQLVGKSIRPRSSVVVS